MYFSLDRYSLVSFSCQRYTVESAHPTGRGNWWFGVRAGTLFFCDQRRKTNNHGFNNLKRIVHTTIAVSAIDKCYIPFVQA